MSRKPGGVMIEDKAEETVTCPYEKAHVMLRKRMAFHLNHCRKNFPNSEKETCPFNNCHIINKEEMKFHTETCESRRAFDNFVYHVGEGAERPTAALPVESTPWDDAGENWDEPAMSVLDEVKENAEKKDVLRLKQGVPKAQRKAFKLEERRRIDALNSHPVPRPSSSGGSSVESQFQRSPIEKNVKFSDKVTAIDPSSSSSSSSSHLSEIQMTNAAALPPAPPSQFELQDPPRLEEIQRRMANLSTQQPTRDKSNPWGRPLQTRQENDYATEFPVLPVARRGRGRGISQMD